MTQPNEQSSETRVRAAVPSAIKIGKYVWSGNDGRKDECLGKGGNEAVNHPSVVAFEAARAPGKAEKPTCVTCGVELSGAWISNRGKTFCGVDCDAFEKDYTAKHAVASIPSSAEPRYALRSAIEEILPHLNELPAAIYARLAKIAHAALGSAKPVNSVADADGFDYVGAHGATGKVLENLTPRKDPAEFYRAIAHVASRAALASAPR